MSEADAIGSARLVIRAADRLADAVAHRIALGHWDARSEAGDALLDYDAGLGDHRAALGCQSQRPGLTPPAPLDPQPSNP